MTRTNRAKAWTAAQRARILRAAQDAKAYVQQHGLVPCDAPNLWGKPKALRYDCISLAVDTGNYWWEGLTDRQITAGMRLLHRILRLGR